MLKSESSTLNEDDKTLLHKVKMLDLYANELAVCETTSSRNYKVSTLTATNDGGFLFVIGFYDSYLYEEEMWASEKGFASRVIKCDKNGKIEFNTPFEKTEDYALQFCFEKGEYFYLFGTITTPETDVLGVVSPSDIYMVMLDRHGNILKTSYIAGSDYDSLISAKISNNGFILSVSAQSSDGDFVGYNSGGYPTPWVFEVDYNLEITKKELKTEQSYRSKKIGERGTTPVYENDKILKDFDAGTAEAFIDYGDFYMIVSNNITGEKENTPPYINAILYNTETVYSAYNNNVKLIFRSAVDS